MKESVPYLCDLDTLREELLSLLCRHRRVHDDLLPRDPVRRGRDLVLVADLERVDDADDLVELAPGRGGVGQGETDLLLRVDDEDGADGEGNTLCVDVCGVLLVEHVVEVRDLFFYS
jgi:hypothetical protein